MSKIIAVLVFSLCIILFVGCNEKQENSSMLSKEKVEISEELTDNEIEPYSTAEKTEGIIKASGIIESKTMAEEASEYEEKVMEMREKILEEAPDAMAGIAFLGYINEKSNDIWEAIDSDGYDSFSEEIPEDKIIKYATHGGEAWCIVPADEKAEVSVVSTESSKVIYKCGNGEPFIIICNGAGDVELTVKIEERTVNQLIERDAVCEDLYDFTVRNIESTYPEIPEGYDIVNMVSDYYERHYCYRPKYADVYDNRDGSSTVRLYDIIDDHTATSAWYEVYENSCMGRDMMQNEEINFLE